MSAAIFLETCGSTHYSIQCLDLEEGYVITNVWSCASIPDLELQCLNHVIIRYTV